MGLAIDQTSSLPRDSSVGFYARPRYNDSHDEDGVEHLVVIDLKTTGLPLRCEGEESSLEVRQGVARKGHLASGTRVDGFILGDKIESGENEPTKHGDNVIIAPLLYDTILVRAEKRLLNLNKKVQEAPFLAKQRKELESFVEPIPVRQRELTE